jgi:uncharacterized membrane protein YphA (DoxX/SURF4 family)
MATNITSQNIDNGATQPKPIARYATATARILMGLIFLVFGLNGFFMFIPAPKVVIPAAAMAFQAALMATGYMIKLVAGTQVITGILLLVNRFVPLALALIAPVIVNIVAFHLFLDLPQFVGPALLVLILEVYLVWVYRRSYAPMLAMRTNPDAK